MDINAKTKLLEALQVDYEDQSIDDKIDDDYIFFENPLRNKIVENEDEQNKLKVRVETNKKEQRRLDMIKRNYLITNKNIQEEILSTRSKFKSL